MTHIAAAPAPIAGLTPWLCTYTDETGHRMQATLHGDSPDTLRESWALVLPGFRVEGRHCGWLVRDGEGRA